jgi:rhodanese-related sulfurtransferase
MTGVPVLADPQSRPPAFTGAFLVMPAGTDALLVYGLLALGLLVAVAFLARRIRRGRGGQRNWWIEVDELSARLEDGSGVAIIDVRSPDEFKGPLGHIAAARNLPIGELPRRLRELDALKGQPVVLVCHTDRRSANAAALLDGAGFCDVRVLRGGMVQWNSNGRPVENRAPQR